VRRYRLILGPEGRTVRITRCWAPAIREVKAKVTWPPADRAGRPIGERNGLPPTFRDLSAGGVGLAVTDHEDRGLGAGGQVRVVCQ